MHKKKKHIYKTNQTHQQLLLEANILDFTFQSFCASASAFVIESKHDKHYPQTRVTEKLGR